MQKLTPVLAESPSDLAVKPSQGLPGFVAKTKTVTLQPGKTFFQVMQEPDNGVHDLLQADRTDQAVFTVPSGAEFAKALASFESEDLRRAAGMFKDGMNGLVAFVDELKGKSFRPATGLEVASHGKLETMMKKASDHGMCAAMITNFIAMSSGAGVLVKIADGNYFINYGYREVPEDPEKSAKSGRSYMATPAHPARDTAYTNSRKVGYLDDLNRYLTPSRDPNSLVSTVVESLVNSDTSGYAKLDAAGQSVATDFLGIYTAELERFLLVPKHSWMNDLAELTLLSAVYGGSQGKIAKEGKLVEGVPADYDYFNPETKRSGIGFTRGDRKSLQQALCRYEWEAHSEEMNRLATLIGAKEGSDLIHGLVTYLNGEANQSTVQGQAKEIISAATAMFTAMHADAAKITADIEAKGLPPVHSHHYGNGAAHADPVHQHQALSFIGREALDYDAVTAPASPASTPVAHFLTARFAL